ncbi:hypothetical protein [Paraclostridium bifermentans]|uniref:hypothetical protein n=1 Tax=Paraclostridium bifermentans TaxID=1490 RepID=UPI00387ABDE9
MIFMYNKNNLSDIEIKRLEKFKNPSLTKIIKLSEELNVDINILLKYFIGKISN